MFHKNAILAIESFIAVSESSKQDGDMRLTLKPNLHKEGK